MQVVILAGWLWTRLSEETVIKPKPMVEIWWKPILWHIMKIYSYYWFNDFIICLWYKWYMIKEWFNNYFIHNSDITIDLKSNNLEIHKNNSESWKVTLIDTWNETMTWWRLKRISKYIKWDNFMVTYWDWLSNVNIKDLISFHEKSWKIATLTAINPSWRFWALKISWNNVTRFSEKKDNNDVWINWWFFVLNRKVFNYIEWDNIAFEQYPLEKLSIEWELCAYKHNWFWHAMDTIKNKNDLEEMWKNWKAYWKIW